jgi:hypothetical protein
METVAAYVGAAIAVVVSGADSPPPQLTITQHIMTTAIIKDINFKDFIFNITSMF